MSLIRVENFLFFLTILLIPTQLGKHSWPKFSYVYSLPIDYLSLIIYFWDLLVVLLLVTYLLRQGLVSKLALNLLFIFLLAQGISLLLSFFSYPLNLGAGLTRLEQYFIIGLFGVYIASQDFKEMTKKIFWPLIIAVFFESFLGVLQFIKDGTIGLWILGERTFTISTPAIAKFDLLGVQFLRPYATFPHPNTLAAFMVLVLPLLLLSKFRDRAQSLGLVVALIWGGIVVLLTVSRVVLIVGLVELLFLIRSKWLIFIVIVLLALSPAIYIRYESLLSFDELSFLRRDNLQEVSWVIFLSHPIFGVGLNNFIPFSADSFLVGPSRFLQPVHNIYLLLLSETGILGLLGFLVMLGYPIFKLAKLPIASYYLLLLWESIIFLGFFDHYFLTQPQGIRLLFLIWGLTVALISTKIS